ncbi:MAG: hypothetical protein OSA44_03005 [Nitrospinaceae bacterium]|jgi:hypothetical protein|nr:hypothetical protein [Nitrospinaceae bacterium]|tara:strand:+ start:450 stop:734 length:285 start_codon:yes stop_codon:yes gene_type:complete
MRIFSLSKISQLWIQATVMMCLVLFSACGKDLEKETFDVYLIDKDGQEKKVDTVTGISQCRMKAENLALYQNYIEYDYHCCLKTPDNSCAEKLK